MVRPGNWHVELDDGSGSDRHAEIDGAAKLNVGEIVPKAHGRDWRIDRIDADSRYAHAVPADT